MEFGVQFKGTGKNADRIKSFIKTVTIPKMYDLFEEDEELKDFIEKIAAEDEEKEFPDDLNMLEGWADEDLTESDREEIIRIFLKNHPMIVE